ncbi:MAG: sulfate permease [Candidatus Omnitrophica bacterium]|nr:sulfate permease [Candidatus Omnitrophota bacterium]
MEILLPKFFTLFKEKYTFSDFVRDGLAGIVVGIVALPLSIAFAIASGVKPEQGLYTAIVAGFIISLLSGSRVQIGGPTGAFVVIVYGIVQKYGYDGLVVATLMAGVILIIMGLARFGRLIEFIPYPITVGFTSGIAVIIFTAQLQNFLGITLADSSPEFIHKIYAIWTHLDIVNFWSVLIGVITIGIILLTPHLFKKIPGSIVAIVVTTVLVAVFHFPVETIYMRFGDIPSTLPPVHIPVFDWPMIKALIMPASTIALLAGLESLLSAVVADGMTGFRHRSNMELIAQGAANIGSALFGGIPATGAIARTATNIKNGGRSPVAGLVHAITLLFILLMFGKWAALIPIPTLAAILIIVAYNMSEWRMFVKLFKTPLSDILVLLTTFLLTVFVDLTVAIQVGVVLAAFLFMKRMVEITDIEHISLNIGMGDPEESKDNMAVDIPADVAIFEINGPFFFGAASKFTTVLKEIQEGKKVLILKMDHVPIIDATGLRAFEDIVDKIKKKNGGIVLSGIKSQPLDVLKKYRLNEKIGEENICKDMDEALARAKYLFNH